MRKNSSIANTALYKIFEAIQNNKRTISLGLFGGRMGQLLFLLFYRFINNSNCINDYCNYYINIINNCLTTKRQSFTYVEGITGILFIYEFLCKNNILSYDVSELKKLYRQHICYYMLNQIKCNNYDILTGAGGPAYYFLTFGTSDDIKILNIFLSYLERVGEYDYNTVKWKSRRSLEDKYMIYNTGLAHGIASIIFILSKYLQKDIFYVRAFRLIEKAINYIFTQKLDPYYYGSYFSEYSKESMLDIYGAIFGCRLSWCHGDLGIATSLYSAGEVLNNQYLKQEAIKIYKLASLYDNDQKEICFCHGTSGIAQLFLRMYQETGIELFAKRNKYWISETIRILSQSINEYSDTSLLNGLSGAGMSIISSLLFNNNKKLCNWDSVFFIS